MSVIQMVPVSETPCNEHEAQIQELSRKTAELEAKNGFKAQRINELIEDNRRIESKIDKLTESVNKSILASVQGDSDLKQRVTNLETKINTQNDTIKQFEEKARKHREDDRAKTNQYLGFITAGICVLTFILTYIFK